MIVALRETVPTKARRMDQALQWERRVQITAHPFAFRLAAALNKLGPTVHVPLVGHVVTDPAVTREILLDTESFSKNGPGSAGELITQVMGEYALLNLEGESHETLRKILVGLMSGHRVRDLVDRIWRPRLDEVVFELRQGRRVDLARLTTILTGLTMRSLLGTDHLASDDDSSAATFSLGERMVAVVGMRNRPLSAAVVERTRERFARLTDEIAQAIPGAPSESIIGALRDHGLVESQLRGVGAALLLTGTGTVSTALPRMVALLCDSGMWPPNSERAARLSLVDECLRVITPSPVMLRSVRRDVVVGGHHFREGRRVAIMTYFAVRSFPDGGCLSPDRSVPASVRGLHFGAGPHQCLGYSLARTQLELSLERLSCVGPLRVAARKAARHVLIPRYEVLEIERAS